MRGNARHSGASARRCQASLITNRARRHRVSPAPLNRASAWLNLHSIISQGLGECSLTALAPRFGRRRAKGLGSGFGWHSLKALGRDFEERRVKGSGQGFGSKPGSRSEIAPW